MAIIKTSLPDDLVQKLSDYAKNLDMPKNKLIEKSLKAKFKLEAADQSENSL